MIEPHFPINFSFIKAQCSKCQPPPRPTTNEEKSAVSLKAYVTHTKNDAKCRCGPLRTETGQKTNNSKWERRGENIVSQKHLVLLSQNFTSFRLHGGQMMDLHPLYESGWQKQHQKVCRLLKMEGGATQSPKSNLRNYLWVYRLQPSVAKFNTSDVTQYDNCSRLSKCSRNLQHGSCLLVAPNGFVVAERLVKKVRSRTEEGGLLSRLCFHNAAFKFRRKW